MASHLRPTATAVLNAGETIGRRGSGPWPGGSSGSESATAAPAVTPAIASPSLALVTRAIAIPAHHPSEDAEPEKRTGEAAPDAPPRGSFEAGTPYREPRGEEGAYRGKTTRQRDCLAYSALSADLMALELEPRFRDCRALLRGAVLRICASYRKRRQSALTGHVSASECARKSATSRRHSASE